MSKRADPDTQKVVKTVRALVRALAKKIASAQRREAPSLVAAHNKRRELFQRRVRRVWGGAVDELTHLILRCWKLGQMSTTGRALDPLDQALVFLWARGCQTAFAICTLLEGGFADDAHGRWRTLYEINIVAQLLRMHGVALAERYFAYIHVKNYKVSLEYDRCAADLKYPAHDPAEIAQLKAKHDEAIVRFPGLGKGDWGWADPAFPKKKPKERITFSDIETAVGLSKWRAHVGMAHHNVHGGPHGAFFRLGNPPDRERGIALAGPSLYGLADPGHACAISLQQLTLQLVLPRSEQDLRDPSHVAAAMALGPLVDRCGRKFSESSRHANKKKPRGGRSRRPSSRGSLLPR